MRAREFIREADAQAFKANLPDEQIKQSMDLFKQPIQQYNREKEAERQRTYGWRDSPEGREAKSREQALQQPLVSPEDVIGLGAPMVTKALGKAVQKGTSLAQAAARSSTTTPTSISAAKSGTDDAFQRMMGKVTSVPSTDPTFQRSMGQVTKEFDPVHHQRLYREYEKNPQYYTKPPAPGEDSYLHAQSLAQFVMNRYPNADIDTLSNIARGLTDISARKALRARQERGW